MEGQAAAAAPAALPAPPHPPPQPPPRASRRRVHAACSLSWRLGNLLYHLLLYITTAWSRCTGTASLPPSPFPDQLCCAGDSAVGPQRAAPLPRPRRGRPRHACASAHAAGSPLSGVAPRAAAALALALLLLQVGAANARPRRGRYRAPYPPVPSEPALPPIAEALSAVAAPAAAADASVGADPSSPHDAPPDLLTGPSLTPNVTAVAAQGLPLQPGASVQDPAHSDAPFTLSTPFATPPSTMSASSGSDSMGAELTAAPPTGLSAGSSSRRQRRAERRPVGDGDAPFAMHPLPEPSQPPFQPCCPGAARVWVEIRRALIPFQHSPLWHELRLDFVRLVGGRFMFSAPGLLGLLSGMPYRHSSGKSFKQVSGLPNVGAETRFDATTLPRGLRPESRFNHHCDRFRAAAARAAEEVAAAETRLWCSRGGCSCPCAVQAAQVSAAGRRLPERAPPGFGDVEWRALDLAARAAVLAGACASARAARNPTGPQGGMPVAVASASAATTAAVAAAAAATAAAAAAASGGAADASSASSSSEEEDEWEGCSSYDAGDAGAFDDFGYDDEY